MGTLGREEEDLERESSVTPHLLHVCMCTVCACARMHVHV